ncbi:hypothetical protein T484DRAFT_1746254 [Baffinella frigidus]|nr:hypothetical protein T484DRAFT_1746254 [Cryptophyta sp. CCMP2293]
MKLVLGALLLLAALAPAESFFTLPSVRFPTTHTAPRAVCLPGASPRRPQVARLVMMASPYDAMTVAVLRENLVTRGASPGSKLKKADLIAMMEEGDGAGSVEPAAKQAKPASAKAAKQAPAAAKQPPAP